MDLQMCRICGGIKQLKQILDKDTEMIYKLLICVDIKIHPADVLPKLICEQCEKNLDLAYRLRKQSDDTQKRLMLQIQRKLKVLNNTFPIDVNSCCRASVSDLPDCENFDLSQNSENSTEVDTMEPIFSSSGNENQVEQIENTIFEFEKPDANKRKMNSDIECIHHTLQPLGVDREKVKFENKYAITAISVTNDVDHEKINNKSAHILNDTCDYNFVNDMKDLIEVPVSEYCSIDLVSSSEASISDCCDDLKNEHVKSTFSDGNAYSCDTCPEVFTNKNEYNMHVKQHGWERYQCIQCCKFFPSRFRLKRHEETHNEMPSHQCSYCNRNYRALYNLKRHISTAHLGKQSWQCNVCNISFSRVDALKRHLQLHSDEKKFRCAMCSKSFKTKDYLCAHLKIHKAKSELPRINKRTKKENANKNQCEYCGKMFKSSFSYKNHLLIHTNEKPHQCDSCNKSFRTIAALSIHQRIHDDYRPYQCDLCLKSFRQTAHLKEHKILHLNTTPKHVCSICQASFAKKSNLKAHMRIHTTEKLFKCADCSADFSYMYLLQRHASKVHCRSVHKVYTLCDIDETLGKDIKVQSKDNIESELYHYIDTVADDDKDELGNNNENFPDLTANNHIPDTSFPDLELITKCQEEQNTFDDIHFVVSVDSEPIGNCLEMHQLKSVQSHHSDEDLIGQSSDDVNQIEEQKVNILVAEETKLTSSIYNVFKME